MATAADSVTGRMAGPLSWVLASLASFCGIVPVLAGGLAVPPQLIVPVAVLAGGILAGLVAGWVRTAFDADSSSRLLPVVGTTAAAALVLSAGLVLAIMVGLPVPILVYPAVAALILGGVANGTAGRLRSPGPRLVRDVLSSLALLAAGAVLLAAALLLFCTTLLTCSAYSGPI